MLFRAFRKRARGHRKRALRDLRSTVEWIPKPIRAAKNRQPLPGVSTITHRARHEPRRVRREARDRARTPRKAHDPSARSSWSRIFSRAASAAIRTPIDRLATGRTGRERCTRGLYGLHDSTSFRLAPRRTRVDRAASAPEFPTFPAHLRRMPRPAARGDPQGTFLAERPRGSPARGTPRRPLRCTQDVRVPPLPAPPSDSFARLKRCPVVVRAGMPRTAPAGG